MFVLAMNARFNHDEGQFIAAGRLFRGGLCLYRDFPSFHMPCLAMIYAGIFHFTDHLFLAARAFSTLCGWLTIVLIVRLAWKAFDGHREDQRMLLACGAGGVLLFNPVFTYAFPLAWNAALPALLAVAAVATHCRGARDRAPGWFFASGLLIAVAMGTRLTYAPLGLPFLVMAWWLPGAAAGQRMRCLVSAGFGLALGLLPVVWAAGLAPDQFLFDNLGYNSRINSAFRLGTQNLDFPIRDKAFFFLKTMIHPGTLALVAGFVWFAVLRRSPAYPRLLVLAIFPFALAGALVPTPSYTQYYYLPVVLSVLGIVFGFAERPVGSKASLWTAAAILVIVTCSGAHAYRHVFFPGKPSNWVTMVPHTTGSALRAQLPKGRVLTLAPLVPLEAGLEIYPEFATGSFGWRTASFLTTDERRRNGFVSESDLPALLAAQPPDGILVNYYDESLEAPLLAFAQKNGYRRIKLPGKKFLWVRPAP